MRQALTVTGVWITLNTLISGFIAFLRAPSVVSIRPELTEVGFRAALFSGRFAAWLYYHHPVVPVVILAIVTGIPAAVAAVE